MTTEQDERRLAEIREFVSPADTVTDRVFLLQMIDQANERIARLEGALETAARFHGIDIDVLCEQRVAKPR